MTRDLVRLEGLFVGGSGGAAVAGAIKYAQAERQEGEHPRLMPDGASKYISKIFNDDWMRENGFLDEEKGLGTVRDLLARQAKRQRRHRDADAKVRDVIDTHEAARHQPAPGASRTASSAAWSHEVDLAPPPRQRAAARSTRRSPPSSRATTRPSRPTRRSSSCRACSATRKLAIVIDRETVVGIVTKIDLIDYLARKATPVAV